MTGTAARANAPASSVTAGTAPPVTAGEPEPDGLVGAATSYWGGAAVALVSGLLRGKVLAVVAGAAGVGLVGQLGNLTLVLGTVAALGLSTAGVQAIAAAKARGDDGAVRRLAGFVVVVPTALSLVVTLAAAAVSPALSALLSGRTGYAGYVAVALLSVPLNVCYAGTLIVLQGFGRLRRLAAVTALGAVLNCAVVVALLWLFGLPGAVASVVATSVLPLAVMLVRERRTLRVVSLRAWPGRPAVRLLVLTGLASLLLGLGETVVETALRSRLVATHGLRVAGEYQPLALASTQVFLQLDLGLTLFLLPALSRLLAAGRPADAAAQVGRGLRLATLVVPVLATVLTAGRAPLMRLLFSAEFSSAAYPFAVQLAGETGRTLVWVLGAGLVPAGRIRLWAGLSAATIAMELLLGVVLAPSLGVTGLAVAFAVAWWLMVPVYWYVGAFALGTAPRRADALRLVRVAALTGAVLLAAARLPGAPGAVTVTALAVGWVAFGIGAEDRSGILHAVRARRRPTRGRSAP